MGLVTDAVKGMRGLNKDLEKAGNKSIFLWNFIGGEIKKQPDNNLIDLRKLINHTLKERRKKRRC